MLLWGCAEGCAVGARWQSWGRHRDELLRADAPARGARRQHRAYSVELDLI